MAMSQRDTRTPVRRAAVAAGALLSISCSSRTSDDSRTDAAPAVASGGKGGSGGRTGGGGSNTGGTGTGGVQEIECLWFGYDCYDGTVSIEDFVPSNGSCVRFVYQCTSGCRIGQIATRYTDAGPTLPRPQTLCNEWDGGVVNAGTKRHPDSGVSEGRPEGGGSPAEASTKDASEDGP
jgi:hypothetical protein